MEKIIFEDLPSTTSPINAQNLNKMQENIEKEVEDSGWIYPTLNSGWTTPYSTAPTRYRKIGKIVHIESFVDATAEASNIIFTLPEGFRPSSQYTRYPVYAGGSWVFIDISNNGAISILNKSGALTWLAINYTFMVD